MPEVRERLSPCPLEVVLGIWGSLRGIAVSEAQDRPKKERSQIMGGHKFLVKFDPVLEYHGESI